MRNQTNLARMTIDLPAPDHQKLKAIAAVLGKSMREVVLEAVEQFLVNSNTASNVKALSKGFDPLQRNAPR